jgi:dienelactone hydrolase
MLVRSFARSLAFFLVVAWSLGTSPAPADQSQITVGVHNNMRATLIAPDGPGPYPGVLVLHTSGGLEEADIAFAQSLANVGYVCLVPAFMAAYGLTAQSRQEGFTRDGDAVYADLVNALETLRNNPKVAGSKLAAVGFSNGGYFAAWLALTGKVAAGVSYYGALTGAASDVSEARFKKAASAQSSPLLILHGLDDGTVPAAAARRLAGILDGVHAPYEIQLYPDTGHLFDRGGFVPSTAFSGGPGGPHGGGARAVSMGPTTGDSAAEADAWNRTLAFFQKYLKPQ